MIIKKAKHSDLDEVTNLAVKLWPDNVWKKLRAEFAALLGSSKDAVYVAVVANAVVGFIHMSLRADYVSSPVGYIKGIYVEEQHRKMGISRKLVEFGGRWAKASGCKEIRMRPPKVRFQHGNRRLSRMRPPK